MNLEFLNPRRILQLAAAIAAVAAAAGVVVVAAAYAVFAVARIWLTSPGASAVVAVLFALVALMVAWLATRPVAPLRKAPPQEEASLVERLMILARERPLIALGAAAAGAVVLLRNPAVLTAIVSAFVAGSASKPEK